MSLISVYLFMSCVLFFLMFAGALTEQDDISMEDCALVVFASFGWPLLLVYIIYEMTAGDGL